MVLRSALCKCGILPSSSASPSSSSTGINMGETAEEINDIIQNMRIPDTIFSEVESDPNQVPKHPVLVFINSKSGGQLGSELLKSYRAVLSENQVFDLTTDKPDKVLHNFLHSLEKLKGMGDQIAEIVQKDLRIIVAGGDGTAGWLLSVVGDLKLSHPPPIATVPLGTGNNLPFSFGWGKKNPGTDVESVKKFLCLVYNANPMNIDSWHVFLKMQTPVGELEPVKLPHSLHSFKKVSKSDAFHEDGAQNFRGGFWNYFSIGMDAEVSYEFHRKREEHPELFKNQLMNQGMYAMIGVTQGWFLANIMRPASRDINQLATILIQGKHDSHWKKLKIPRRIRSVVMLNLPSFSGGLNPWGTPRDTKFWRISRDSSKLTENLTPAYVNDGLIELVGFKDGWHGLTLLAPNGHGTRLAQAHKVRIEFHKNAGEKTYMRLDGEPWLQPLPTDESTTILEITALRQAVMLTTGDCIAKCIDHQAGEVESTWGALSAPASTVSCSPAHLEIIDFESEEHDTEEDDGEDSQHRKFGAADTFKIT